LKKKALNTNNVSGVLWHSVNLVFEHGYLVNLKEVFMIAAIIVLYHPEPQAIIRLLASLEGQVDSVLAIDNTPGSALPGSELFSGIGSHVTYLPLGSNKGIAEAQNIGIRMSMKNGYSHVLLLDQDSALAPEMTKILLDAERELLGTGKRIAALCPQIVDERTGKRPIAVYYNFGFVRKIWANESNNHPVSTHNFIASGSLLRIDALQNLGLMREDLFIEYVDTEWALRAFSAGYECYCVPKAVLLHNFGDATAKLFGKDIYLYSNLRYYYKLRNEVFIARLKTMGWRWRAYALLHIPYHFIVYSAFSKTPLTSSRLFMKAMWNGMLGRLGPVSIP